MGCLRDCFNAILCRRRPVTEEMVAATRTAAETGDSEAQKKYGEYLINGRGVEKDVSLGILFLARSANQDGIYARHKLHKSKIKLLEEEPLNQRSYEEILEITRAMQCDNFLRTRGSAAPKNLNLHIFNGIIDASYDNFNIEERRALIHEINNNYFGTTQIILRNFITDLQDTSTNPDAWVGNPEAQIVDPAQVVIE